ncbi:MAG: cytochrome c oxidase assembly protein [Pseudomonadota bacterium]
MIGTSFAIRRGNRQKLTAGFLAVMVAMMVGLAYLSVPLYELFCRVTGFGGTTQRADSAPTLSADAIDGPLFTVRFDSNIASSLAWSFKPEVRMLQDIQPGEVYQVDYRAENLADIPLTGTATFNVTPQKIGEFFIKIECFCFQEQTLQPGQRIDMPVQFYIDPEIVQEVGLEQVRELTLSYTFFPSEQSG